MKTNGMTLRLTFLVVMIALVNAFDERPSNLRMDVSAILKEARNAVRQHKIRKMLLQSRLQRQKMEEASARADEAVMTASNHKDAKKAMAVAKEMRHAADEAGAMTWALTAMEHKSRIRQRAESSKISDEGRMHRMDDTTDPKDQAESDTKGELTDPDEASPGVRKLSKKTHENLERKPDHEIIISKGMTKDEVKMNGEIAKKLVKESEDKKANGEEIVDKQANLEIDRSPEVKNMDYDNGAFSVPMLHKVTTVIVVVAFTFLLVA